jgi:hypothetical protein
MRVYNNRERLLNGSTSGLSDLVVLRVTLCGIAGKIFRVLITIETLQASLSPRCFGRVIGALSCPQELWSRIRCRWTWAGNSAGSYSIRYLHASITMMATIGRLSPSHFCWGLFSFLGSAGKARLSPITRSRPDIDAWQRWWTCSLFAQNRSSLPSSRNANRIEESRCRRFGLLS